MCYAYRYRGSEELLLEHLVNVARCCQSRWEFKALSGKISRLLNLAEDDVGQAIVLAALLHDIGKAVQEFQQECIKSGCREFPKHYLISTFLVHLAFEVSGISVSTNDVTKFFEDEIGGMDKSKVLELLVILPIAFHHYHQVRGVTSYRAHREDGASFVDNLSIWIECCKDLSELEGVVHGDPWSTVVRVLQSILPSIEQHKQGNPYRSSGMFIRNFYETVKKNLVLTSITLSRTMVESIAGLINLCDGRVAYEARRGRAAVR